MSTVREEGSYNRGRRPFDNGKPYARRPVALERWKARGCQCHGVPTQA